MLSVQLSHLSASPTAVRPNRCLLQRNGDATCKYCLNACPQDALHFAQRVPYIDTARCSGCGLCLVACPTECFESERWSERTIIRALAHVDRSAVDLVCKCHPDPQAGHDTTPVIQVNACLGAISPGLWFEIGLKYTVTIRLEYCAACPNGQRGCYAQQAIEVANSWLKSCGETSAADTHLIVRDAADEQANHHRRVVISAERPPLSRRDFLFGFARSSGPGSLALTNLPAEAADETHKTAPHLPVWLRQLAAIYPTAHAVVDDRTAPTSHLLATGAGAEQSTAADSPHWPTLQVNANCTACRACAMHCPSGALSTAVAHGMYQHAFTPGLCVACGLCARLCPTGALSRSYTVDQQPFEKRIVAERPAVTCRKCGAPALRESNGLCFCCANEPSVNSILENASHYLFGG